MTQRFYPAVLERGEGEVIAVWFPDFPGCVAAATDQQAAIAKAQDALAAAVQATAERDEPLPAPSAFQDVEVPDDTDFIALIAIPATLPNPSERVNVYLPKALIERMDRSATEMGMSRSSLVGFAVSRLLEGSPAAAMALAKRRK
ncbi:type II toxin-antitoxin system HicB family antitoxin [Caulobacter sp. KR2-114]|uniref:type II toxin-antitoxin system HicB family antitoxin n=1 Tax=Caulobacter sp. KR2-114 TaxID=3400912 RepID=UPI003BFC9137